jgi:hypothetical protein
MEDFQAYIEEAIDTEFTSEVPKRPPLWSSSQSFWPLTRRSGFDSQLYQIFWVAVVLERGPLRPCEIKWGAAWKKSSGSGLENWD